MPNIVLQKAILDITALSVLSVEELRDVQGPADPDEIAAIESLCNTHPQVLEATQKLQLPAGTQVINDPWAYGTDDETERRRLYQCYMYLVLNVDPEANHYSIPLPFSPVFDAYTMTLQWVDYLPLGDEPTVDSITGPWDPVAAVEYSSRLLKKEGQRTDLTPLHVHQPKGPSFTVNDREVSWQKWKFILGWNLREGPVLYNVTFGGQPSTAFDLGDTGLGINSNSLELGCDCLGHIRYFDGCRVTSTGELVQLKNVVCMHEIDAGIGLKHVNFRSQSASVTRNRQLVVQCVATVANYEYILAFILDQSANIHIELRATGIVSTVPISPKATKVPPWGVKVAPGALALNHQHLFCLRVNPAIDGQQNSVVFDDIVPLQDGQTDPYGVAFLPSTSTISKPGGYNLDLTKSRVYRIQNSNVVNPVSGKPVAYKLHALPSQMMIMNEETFNSKRGIFASEPIWVTAYHDDELYTG
ncbi:hypothetical protein UA08_08020 [Talaromyces atroroseus]|uniref:Amine oxidase n=1 Tax=Talaromyces atroroseus TaxID=1441469 RepID=A0A225AID2_TALAT|nr:hypothetical protein UA08_08020 [Talaromyces atroroseus]OKL56888.1 hypothetical protein UA08_08020 [Talaromyces atroroseus]